MTMTMNQSETVPDATKKRKKKRGLGGWLLIEVTLGGVMASVALGALLVNVGDSMDKSVVVSRKLTAQMLAKQGIEEVRALATPQTSLANGTVTLTVPASLRGSYTRTRTVTSGTTTAAGLNMSFKDVTVTVTFPNRADTKSVSLQTRIYDP
jgi:type II secretory pathway pseudopilin PulG